MQFAIGVQFAGEAIGACWWGHGVFAHEKYLVMDWSRRRRRRGALVVGCAARLASKTAMASSVILYRGLPPRFAAKFIAGNSPDSIHPMTLSGLIPRLRAYLGGLTASVNFGSGIDGLPLGRTPCLFHACDLAQLRRDQFYVGFAEYPRVASPADWADSPTTDHVFNTVDGLPILSCDYADRGHRH